MNTDTSFGTAEDTSAEPFRPFWRVIPRFTSEYSLADCFRAASALVSQGTPLESELRDIFPKTPFYFLRSGRESLYLILKALPLPQGCRVGVPLYCCMSVFQAIAAAGHVPVFLDVDPNDYSVDDQAVRKNKEKLDALVIVHTFGYPVNIQRVRQALAGRNVPIIEDCAHALMSTYQGRPVGTVADVSYFSFAMHKPAAVGGGALILVNNPDFIPAVEREVGRAKKERLIGEIRQSFVCAVRGFAYQRSVYGALMSSPIRRLRDRAPRLPTTEELNSIHYPWSLLTIRRVDRALLHNRIRDFRRSMSALAENTWQIRNDLRDVSIAIPAEPPYGTWNHFALPVRYTSAAVRDQARCLLLKRGIDTAPIFEFCAENARWFGYDGGCPQAETLAKTVCCIPNHSWLSGADVSYIAGSLRLTAETHEIHTPATLLWQTSRETQEPPGARII